MIRQLLTAAAVAAFSLPLAADERETGSDSVEHYVIDTEGSHASIRFKTSHMGFSKLHGRFNDFSGELHFDPENPRNSSAEVTIRTASVDTNHEDRDDHLRSDDFLTVDEHPQAHFRSTGFEPAGDNAWVMTGELTLMGVTRPIEMDVRQVGAGKDPWGGFRRGFEGRTVINRADFGDDYDLGEASEEVSIMVSIEGIRQDDEAQDSQSS